MNSLVLKALNDGKVTDDELYLIVNQMIQYRPLTSKEEIRKKIRKLRTMVVEQPLVVQPDLEKIRQDIREKVRKRLPPLPKKKKSQTSSPAESFFASIFVTVVSFLLSDFFAFSTSIFTKSLGVLVCYVYPLIPRSILLLSFFSN